MSPEELDEARAKEAYDEWIRGDRRGSVIIIAARLAREGWKPFEPVDPDVLAFRKWADGVFDRIVIREGNWDGESMLEAYLAGARMATERERERAKVLVEYAEIDAARLDLDGDPAREALAKYEEGLK